MGDRSLGQFSGGGGFVHMGLFCMITIERCLNRKLSNVHEA